jgi:hypothetical protein
MVEIAGEIRRESVRNKFYFAILLFVGLFTLAAPAFAHHGNASYDFEKTVTLKGTVTSWVWSNPHCLLRFDVKDEKGNVQHWVTEVNSPVDMLHAGWSSSAFKPGDEITIDVMPSKNGTPVGRIRQVTLSDGTILKATTRYGI